LKRWLVAARPRTLGAAFVPVAVAAAAAQRDGVFDWQPFVLTLVGALSIQIAANFANDASDAKRGADTPDRVGPPRFVASGLISSRRMWTASWLAVAVAALCGALLAWRVGPVVLLIGVLSVAALLGYVGGPIPYGYRGLGEVFVLGFFGLIATAGSRLSYDGRAPGYIWCLGIPIGMLAAAILMANNLRDLPTDERVGKRTLAVMLGEARARIVFFGTLWAALLLTLVLVVVRIEPTGVLLSLVAAGFVLPLHRLVLADDRRTYLPLLGGAARVHLGYGALVVLGLLL
jgi:1,4-dihydroxy-2-naphthoate octaprenyltransferase